MATTRTAEVTWNGSLLEGSGTIERVGSGAFAPLPVSWPSRAEEPGGMTSPEELIAAAWASCFSMALANGLTQAGNPPERLSTSVSVTFVPGTGITKGEIAVRGSVPGLEADAFQQASDDAKQNCPVSKALTGIPDVSLDATLE
jgi:osmotically inducible protein OsmC